jgi:hypothetical protein
LTTLIRGKGVMMREWAEDGYDEAQDPQNWRFFVSISSKPYNNPFWGHDETQDPQKLTISIRGKG